MLWNSGLGIYSYTRGQAMPQLLNVEEKFLSFTEPCPATGCWLWVGSVRGRGYGRFWDEKTVVAHRMSWELFRGAIPEGKYVLHRCDVPVCVNPQHLWLGTAKDNYHDMVKKKRATWQTKDFSTCKRGHKLEGGNLSPNGKQRNRCRICHNQSAYKSKYHLKYLSSA